MIWNHPTLYTVSVIGGILYDRMQYRDQFWHEVADLLRGHASYIQSWELLSIETIKTVLFRERPGTSLWHIAEMSDVEFVIRPIWASDYDITDDPC